MRISISDEEAQILLDAISKITMGQYKALVKDELIVLDRLSDNIKLLENREATEAQKSAMKKATNTRVNKARKKIESAVNMLRLGDKPISVYSVAKEAKVSYNTAVKYKDFIYSNS